MSAEFIIIEHQQGTPEWLEWRHQGIGASDAPAILGESRFRTPEQIFAEKCEPARDVYQNSAMAAGTRLEPIARKRYIATTGKEVEPACLQSTRYEWLRASLDGISRDHDSVVEIKCGESVYRRVSYSRSVPEYYYGQLQHILAITGLSTIDFWCHWPHCPDVLLEVPRNDAYIKRLLKNEEEFWNRVKQKR